MLQNNHSRMIKNNSKFVQVITTCICASTNALVILIFLFFPKLYIIICVPEKNTRANFTTTKGIRCIIGRDDSSQSTNKG